MHMLYVYAILYNICYMLYVWHKIYAIYVYAICTYDMYICTYIQSRAVSTELHHNINYC